MPEGDTVHKVANVLRKDLDGEVLSRCLVRGVYGSERLAGSRVLEVEVHGKHLLVHFDRDVQLRVHLGMRGSWHRYPPGAAWKRSKASAAVILETKNVVLVCFQALDVEIIPTPQRRWHRQLGQLGPDLLGVEEPDWSEVLARASQYHVGSDFLGEVLLDQRVASGIGNVYKSELAFMGPLRTSAFEFVPERGYSPWEPLSEVPPEVLDGLFRRARILLQANLGGWFRTTRVDRRVSPQPVGGDLYVYGRPGEKCYRCGAAIARGHQGLQNRVTYWCPECQPA